MKISAYQYTYTEPFTKEQVPRFFGKQEGSARFFEVELPPEALGNYFRNNLVWSPFLFKDGIRHGDNNLGEVWCLVLDYDDGRFDADEIYQKMLKTETFGFLQHYQVIFYESPSYGKEGLYKYRIIIPFREPLKIDRVSWKKFYGFIIRDLEKQDIYIDNIGDMARIFYSTSFNKVYQQGDKILNSIKPVYSYIKKLASVGPKSLKFNKRTNSDFDGPITPDNLVKQPKYIEYLDRIQPGNYHLGEIALIGYLTKCDCSKSDIEQHIIETRGSTGSNPNDTQHNNRMQMI